MSRPTPLALVRDWQDAANRGDAARLLALSDPAIEVAGPRGASRGHDVLRAWLDRAGLRLTTRRAFARGDAVVLAQRGVWRDPQTGAVTGERDLASAFRVAGGRVARVARHDDLAAALADAGLVADDERAA
ncbi:MAG TPA: nuclear transport factor 2 family protein [Thermomicrobiales bacterium]|nr:nuclear transport factor 2 family protein [Thermomicrobiales bacterium]